jgi:hypothetical protein
MCKKVIVKHKHLSINKEVSIGSRTQRRSQNWVNSVIKLVYVISILLFYFRSVICKLFIIKVYLDR